MLSLTLTECVWNAPRWPAEGWRYEPRVRPYRLANRNPFFEGVEPDEHRMGSTKFPDGIDLFGDRSEPEMWNLANSIRALCRREEVRRDFQAPAQGSVKVQQKAVARTAPLLSLTWMKLLRLLRFLRFLRFKLQARRRGREFRRRAISRRNSRRPKRIGHAGDSCIITDSAEAIPLRLPDFVVPGIIHPDLEDSMVAASVAPPFFEQRHHSTYHFGALSKILVKMMTNYMFGPTTQSGGHLLEKTTFASSPFFNEAREEMIMNDRPTTGNIGGKGMLSIRVTPSVSDRLRDIHVSEIDYDNALRTLYIHAE